MKRIGIVSDSHSLVRSEVIEALGGCDHILHAGDIGSQAVIDELSRVSSVTAINGNIDKGELGARYPSEEVIEIDNIYIYMLHNIHDLDLDPVAAGFQVVVSGHSHKPSIENKEGVLYINPGSIGPRRFKLPIALAILVVENEELCAEVLEIDV